MEGWKRCAALLLAALLSLSLAACGKEDGSDVAGADWRTTGIVRAEGTVTRGGEDTDVLVCVHAEDAALYYDAAEQMLYAAVDYPAAIQGDAWAAFQSIDFADRNGDGSSDVAMLFREGDGMTLLVWFWDETAEQFVFQPEESSAMRNGGAA